MNRGWKMFRDAQAWNGSSRLFITRRHYREKQAFVAPLVMIEAEFGQAYDTPALAESYEEKADGLGDVSGFLQAALDCAWEAGMRPTGFADHTNELAAVRYHLEDMRALAKVSIHPTAKGS